MTQLGSLGPSFYLSPPLKPLRRVLHPLIHHSLAQYKLPDYPALTTALLSPPSTAKDKEQAILYLSAIRDMGIKVKQGTVQRWVRMASGTGFGSEVGGPGRRVRLLAGIVGVGGAGDDRGEGPNAHDPTRALTEAKTQAGEGGEGIWDMGTFELTSQESGPTETTEAGGDAYEPDVRTFAECLRIPGPDRKPPNASDLVVRMSSDPVCNGGEGAPPTLFQTAQPPNVKKHKVEGVEGAFVLENVLGPRECEYVRSTMELMGFSRNQVVGKEDTGIGECEWMTCEAKGEGGANGTNEKGMLGAIWNRVRDLVPTVQGKKPVGINARWRGFRYREGGVYRMHIDGSWVRGGVRKGRLVEDDGGGVKSRLTFLMYLNDDFEGGETTFFAPRRGGGLEGRKVRPRKGSVLVFPQGNERSLLHEGSGVKGGGTKWVVRTDVLYEGF
ncbi:hypothetical protein TrRE_jg2799 [Triparma retinervis]|uniref:Fe2OG dioxygenase domain-containing protein n=1 Tax=Triparma retinervis TaxID=2557542 RepID=A0A9W6ZGA2_9STRA|nr:hypothetical protein TrRE_jg2799 [Triparma retinervis]